MSHHQHILICFLLIPVAVLIAGCDNKVKVRGTVVFADDQSPLPLGTVLLQNDTYAAKGQLDAAGHFQISSVKKNDGVPPGVYQVAITGAIESPESTDLSNKNQTAMDVMVRNPSQDPIPLIEPRYMNPRTSGITFDTSKDNVLNITVERAK